MKTLYQNILYGFSFWLTAWLTILLTISLAWVIYAQVNNVWTNPTDLEAITWNSLTSTSWNKILSNQKYLSETMAWLWEAPQNSVMAFASTSCPSWWKAADWTNGTPDLRGVFIRWANNFGTGNSNRDSDRAAAWSWVLTYQDDAIRNITWYARWNFLSSAATDVWWVLWNSWIQQTSYMYSYPGGWPYWGAKIEFDASLVVPTGSDNRPKNVALIYCVKN